MAAIDGVQHDLTSLTTEQIVDLGIALVPEGRRLFPKLTVEENLALGAFRPHRPRADQAKPGKPASKHSPGWPRGGASLRDRCRVASSRCWRSAAR